MTAGRARRVLSPEACWAGPRGAQVWGEAPETSIGWATTLSFLESRSAGVLQESWSPSPLFQNLPQKGLVLPQHPSSSMALLLSWSLSRAASSWGNCPGTVPSLPRPESPLWHLSCCFGLCPLDPCPQPPWEPGRRLLCPVAGSMRAGEGPGVPPRCTPRGAWGSLSLLSFTWSVFLKIFTCSPPPP